MHRGVAEDVRPGSPTIVLLPKHRTILERDYMEFRPFGVDEQGEKIRDLTGMSIRATVLYLEASMRRKHGESAGLHAVQELCALLNERIKDPVYHVTPAFLKNAWNSYSYEFTAYMYEFCEQISGDPQFVFRGGMEKASPIMQVLARPFSLAQIYGMFPYFGNKFASGSIECRVVGVTRRSAALAMRFSDRTLRQFGPYRRRCTFVMCQAAQGIISAVPAQVHGLAPAALTETSCIANDDPWCQWDIAWSAEPSGGWMRRMWPVLGPADPTAVSEPAVEPMQERTGTPPDPAVFDPAPLASGQAATSGRSGPMLTRSQGAFGGYLWAAAAAAMTSGVVRVFYPAMSLGEVLLAGLMPLLLAGTWVNWRLRRESQRREALIQEQIEFVESRHEELREAYLEQERTRVELRRSVNHLTVLHRAGLLFSSTLDRETLLASVLESLTRDLHFDRAMISFYDAARGVTTDARLVGVPPEIQALARAHETPVADPDSLEGTVLLQGKPLLIGDMQHYGGRMHPHTQRLLRLTGTKSLLAVPLKTKDRILGSMIVDRKQEHSLTQEDLELIVTFAHQVAIALDNASAYQQIEELNVGLEAKVLERTKELEQADRLRSQFLSHVSHELKTPMTSIKGFLQNMLDGLTGSVNEKQQRYLSRMLQNSDRLIRMIEDLLDRTRIQTGKLELSPAVLDLEQCVAEVVEQLKPLAQAKRQRLEAIYSMGQAHVSACAGRAGENDGHPNGPEAPLLVLADRDRLVQIVINLVQNAMKFTPEDGAITVTVAKENHRHAGVTVRDTGPGIPSESLEKIFDPFFRVAATRTTAKGLGLGLSIVRTLVELHGGTIEARRPDHGGAEFHFTLPLRFPAESGGAVPQANRCILVVDDDKDIRDLLEDRLRAMGYQVETETDGLRALKTAASGRFSGLILDIGLPSLDGMEVLKQIRQFDERLPIIMVTASGAKETAIKAISLGAQAYLLKPFDIDELQRIVESCFRTVP